MFPRRATGPICGVPLLQINRASVNLFSEILSRGPGSGSSKLIMAIVSIGGRSDGFHHERPLWHDLKTTLGDMAKRQLGSLVGTASYCP